MDFIQMLIPMFNIQDGVKKEKEELGNLEKERLLCITDMLIT